MALIHCPECGREISDRAPACVHCGYPLVQPNNGRDYSVVLLEAEPHAEQTRNALLRLGVSKERVAALLGSLPAAAWSGLSLTEAYQKADAFEHCGLVKVVRDGDVRTREDMLRATPVARADPKAEFPFWPTVGAVLAAFLIWNGALLLLGLLFS